MFRTFMLISLLAVAGSPATASTLEVSFHATDRRQLEQLEASGDFEIVSVRDGIVTALFTERTRGDRSALSALPRLRVHSENIDAELDVFRARASVGKYHTVETATAELKDLAARHPDICRLESIGRTFEGRDIWALRVTAASGE